ncbi:MAG: hypothetical protein Q9216_005256 [Gyalolechia sp. 2 TL-2023]
MPPSNSPTDIPVMDATTSPFFELEALARPVPDLASTLTTAQAEQDANDANVSFLRTPISDEDLSATAISDDIHVLRRQIREERENRAVERGDSESQRRMRQVEQSLRLRQMEESMTHRRYSPLELQEVQDRIPTAPRASAFYHGWAPSMDNGRSDSADWSGLPTMSRSSADFYNEQRRAIISASRHLNSSTRDSSTVASRGSGNGPHPLTSDSSLRTAALLQSVRRNSTSLARSRSLIHSQISERERSGLESESRNHSSALDSRRRSGLGSRGGRQQTDQSPSQMASSLHDLARHDWIMNSHQRRQEEELQSRQEGSDWHLEDAIKYLERLRFCDSYQDSVSSAAAGGFVREDFFTTNHDDFILDTAMIDPPAESSWLKIGGVFSGSQHATNGSTSFLRDPSFSQRSRTTEIPQLGQAQALPTNRHSFSYGLSDTNTSMTRRYGRSRDSTDDASRQFRTLPLNSAAERSLEQPSSLVLEDRWPVKVKVHSIDYENMTLAGTMEAFNVPDKNSQTQVSSITTFLEGEIIDFNVHTLETKNYKTDENTDSIYWRMLEPFKKLTDDEMVRGLVSKKWMREKLRERYILMRWKEKCFVKPLDASSVLTISGFYYISMRRSDGHVEGLYYDPSSTPFQHLSMAPEGKRHFPTYKFT